MNPNSNNVNMLTKLLETWNPRQTTANTIGRPRDNFIIVPQNPEEGGKNQWFPTHLSKSAEWCLHKRSAKTN